MVVSQAVSQAVIPFGAPRHRMRAMPARRVTIFGAHVRPGG